MIPDRNNSGHPVTSRRLVADPAFLAQYAASGDRATVCRHESNSPRLTESQKRDPWAICPSAKGERLPIHIGGGGR